MVTLKQLRAGSKVVDTGEGRWAYLEQVVKVVEY
jgi:biotin synthase-related radical SAM superfamily protein